ncbi:protein-L-isoaspartate(D-aspartate) O-methyltransferase [bacterium]|nr:protein-L-isoaspartate(D-aspartate) O-methyltransferase [bacterium]
MNHNSPEEESFAQARSAMVRDQLRGSGIRDERVLAAMAQIPRELFLPPGLRSRAYENGPVPIGRGQTISQPYIVALMAEALLLQGHERVLEVGLGSGYSAAVLSRLARQVYSIERHAELARQAAQTLASLGCDNVQTRTGNGALGWPEEAPFAAISVAAAGPEIPPALKQQLEIGGRLVLPCGQPGEQRLLRLTRLGAEEYRTEDLGWVAFVPLVDSGGEEPPDPQS